MATARHKRKSKKKPRQRRRRDRKKKYFCEYCDIYLAHDNPKGRKDHNIGKKHKMNVKAYYSNLLASGDFIPPPASLVPPLSSLSATTPTTTTTASTNPAIAAVNPMQPHMPPQMMPMMQHPQHPPFFSPPPFPFPPPPGNFPRVARPPPHMSDNPNLIPMPNQQRAIGGTGAGGDAPQPPPSFPQSAPPHPGPYPPPPFPGAVPPPHQFSPQSYPHFPPSATMPPFAQHPQQPTQTQS